VDREFFGELIDFRFKVDKNDCLCNACTSELDYELGKGRYQSSESEFNTIYQEMMDFMVKNKG
jgi:hypothetical protein